MKIWIDADACPSAVKDIIVRAAVNKSIQTIFVANKFITMPRYSMLSSVLVEKGADVADQYIVQAAVQGDLVITQDIPLAALLVAKNVVVMSVHGTLYSAANIGERLSLRNFSQSLRDAGMHTSGPKPFSQQDRQRFADCFDKQLSKLLKNV